MKNGKEGGGEEVDKGRRRTEAAATTTRVTRFVEAEKAGNYRKSYTQDRKEGRKDKSLNIHSHLFDDLEHRTGCFGCCCCCHFERKKVSRIRRSLIVYC